MLLYPRMSVKNVIIVEDSKLFLQCVVNEFRKFSDINVLSAQNYSEATKVLRENQNSIHFAILDLNLPDASSDKVVALFNAHHIPSLILTSTTSSKIRDEVFKKDVVDYVIKNGENSISYAVKKVYSFLKHHEMSIVVADDSKLYRDKIKYSLRHLNINILEADDGLKALKLIKNRQNNISILITDYNMPNMDGLELAMKVRSIYTKDDFSIIATSSIDDRETIKKFIKIGANDFIIKPFSDDEVFIKVHANIELIELFNKFFQ